MTDVLNQQKSELKKESRVLELVLALMAESPLITIPVIVEKSGMSRTAIQNAIRLLKEQGRIERIGSKRNGCWEVMEQ